MTKSEQLLARRSLHSKDFLHFVCFFPIDFVIVNPELSQWTIEKSDSFVRNKDYKHSEMVFFCYPISLKKKGCLQLPWFEKDQFTNFHWLYSISSFLHPFRAELTNAPTVNRHRWNSEILAIKKPQSRDPGLGPWEIASCREKAMNQKSQTTKYINMGPTCGNLCKNTILTVTNLLCGQNPAHT